MDETLSNVQKSSEIKNVLPDVVHSQQIDGMDSGDDNKTVSRQSNEESEAESISELIPSKFDSLSDIEVRPQLQGLPIIDQDTYCSTSPNKNETQITNELTPTKSGQHEKQTSWNLDVESSDNHISHESPVNLPLSSDTSNDTHKAKVTSSLQDIEITSRSERIDSLNISHKTDTNTLEQSSVGVSIKDVSEFHDKCSSGPAEIIKLDIRGKGEANYPNTRIYFGALPDCDSLMGSNIGAIQLFQSILAPTLPEREGVVIEEIFDDNNVIPLETKQSKLSLSNSITSASDKIEQDVLVEEVTVDFNAMREDGQPQAKSLVPEETMSFSTLSTDYRTICEDYHAKLVHLEENLTKRDQRIEQLTLLLQQYGLIRDNLLENKNLTDELHNHKNPIAEQSCLSDFIKYEIMLREDNMSVTASLRSSNGEKDNDCEEITINYSKSDEFQTGFENTITGLFDEFEDCIEDDLRIKLRDSISKVFDNEIEKLRIDYDKDIKEKQCETRRLRELLASVGTGNADIEALRRELSLKHEKEMEHLRMFFEKKCTTSYSEDVWRGRSAGLRGSDTEGEGGAGDAARCTRTPDPSAHPGTSTPIDVSHKKSGQYLAREIEDMKSEHLAFVNEMQMRHTEEIKSLEEQIAELNAHIQTRESGETEAPATIFQDIDLELEKGGVQRRIEQVQRDMLQHMQEQLQVLLSDPEAELSSWPLELVALRDKIHEDKNRQEREISSLREEATDETDKWRQRRNNTFDQNRQLEEVTKERDDLKRTSCVLQHTVSQLVAYCASAEDELNKTVLQQLFDILLPHDQTFNEDSRPCSPIDPNTSVVSRGKRVHFAPDLDSILGALDLDDEGVCGVLQQQRDLSVDIKRELEHSLRRLRQEAHDLLELSAKLASNRQRNETKMLESSSVQITELVEELDLKQRNCEHCERIKREMEEAVCEGRAREGRLRGQLAGLLAPEGGDDVIAEGYGTVGARGGWLSPQESSPRRELELLSKERDDLQQQLEAANRKLQSTRQFLEEQTAEREGEREEAARRIRELGEERAQLAARLQGNARILNEVEQLENQAREMNILISELEKKKASTGDELNAAEEKVALLRDVVVSLESQLEQKAARETEIVAQLEEMRQAIDDRDGKMRSLLQDLEALRKERVDSGQVACASCEQEEDRLAEYVDKIREQCHWVERRVSRRVARLERSHEVCSAHSSEPSEDVSLGEHRGLVGLSSPDGEETPRLEMSELGGVWERLQTLARAEDTALKRIADLEMQRAHLNDLAQEVRAERDVLQTRMSEQALKISSLSVRLAQQRNDAEVLAQTASSELAVRLHDAHSEVQRLKDELEIKDKQLARLKHNIEERTKINDTQDSLYGNSCNPKDKVVILERELSNAQSRIAQLEDLASKLEMDNAKLSNEVKEQLSILADKEEQLNQIMALKLDDEQNQKSEVIEGKTSGRTLSDIVSISEYDEQDLQMRRAELKNQNINLSGAPFESRDKTQNRTLPPDVQRPDMSSLNIDNVEHFDVTFTPRAESLPSNFTSTQHKEIFKRNLNEMTASGRFGESAKHSTALNIPNNCSIYPNQDVCETKKGVQPKKINFSLEISDKTHEFTYLEELGIVTDVNQENFPDILSHLKDMIKKSRTELETCKSELKNAEEQLNEFPAIKEKIEELKASLENTMATMEKDKMFYESQLENFSSNKKILEQKLIELSQEVNEKSQDLNLLKEDILRRENMVLELAKEKRNLSAKITELDSRIDELKKRNSTLEKHESENQLLKEKVAEFQKVEQLVSEKNQQIDSLNQHLDRLDDFQRKLNDKTEEADSLKESLEQKTNELFQMQDSIVALNRDITKVVEENNHLGIENKELKQNLTKLGKEQESSSLKLQNSETELERITCMNEHLTAKVEEMKQLTDRLRDKEKEIGTLHDLMNFYHNEISSLKEQLKMVSRSPSPKNKSVEGNNTANRHANDDRKQLNRIKKELSLLQHELEFNRKELNDKAFELAKAKLDIKDLTNSLSEATKHVSDKDGDNNQLAARTKEMEKEIEILKNEKDNLTSQLDSLLARLREESNIGELKEKLQRKAERCRELECELRNMRETVDRDRQEDRYSARSPTAELESALRQQLNHSRALDDRIMEQILSASSDDREDEVPRLALNTSKSSSIVSTSSERCHRLRAENDKLQLQVDHLQARLRDKDALIHELNCIREQLRAESEGARLRQQAESDNSARLQLMLDAQNGTAAALQKQDSSTIEMLKRRLESAMRSEMELREREQQMMDRIRQLEASGGADSPTAGQRRDIQAENVERLKGEVRMAKSKLEQEAGRSRELQSLLETSHARAARQLEEKNQLVLQLKGELAELRRLKHEAGAELARARELVSVQNAAIHQLEKAARQATSPVITDLNDSGQLYRTPRTSTHMPTPTHTPTSRAPPTDDDKEQIVRYLQGRCLRLESWRKALVWQKRYLLRVVTSYEELEKKLRLSETSAKDQLRGKRRFRAVVYVAVIAARMAFLVRRRAQVRSYAANAILPSDTPNQIYSSTSRFATPAVSWPRALLTRHLKMEPPSSPTQLLASPKEFQQRPSSCSPRSSRYLLSSPRADLPAACPGPAGRCARDGPGP